MPMYIPLPFLHGLYIEEWKEQMDVKPYLSMLKQIEDYGMESSCAWLKTKNERRMMLKLKRWHSSL